MKIQGLLVVLCFCAPMVPAQEETLDLNDLIATGQQWAQDNLDDRVLGALGEVDEAKVRQFLEVFQKELAGDNVFDLADLRTQASEILPLLEAHPATQPYAEWLKSRMDYFAVAETLKQRSASVTPTAPTRPTPPTPTLPTPPTATKSVKPNKPYLPVPNPSAEAERQVWRKQLAKRAAPTEAQPMVPRLKSVFNAEKTPAQLIWLAEVESGFNPSARSPSGATGLFQMMPGTAKNLGLSLRPQDERMNPEKSAHATARYLNYLHGKFKDWPLALAAYNAGEGNVQKLLNKHKAKTFDAIATHLPAETQMYVPKIDATLQRREGVSLAQLRAPQA
jgi:membrane-bound lytic murein transglycosylase D